MNELHERLMLIVFLLKSCLSECDVYPPISRLSAEAKEKKHFFSWCQDVGILDVLPYHECDLTSRDQPDYLTCLVHLQVQNISARYHVFLTGETHCTNTFIVP